MQLKEISKDIYDVDTWLDEGLGKEGTPDREKNREKAWEEYNAQILLEARKNARLTQSELAKRIGADKGYISDSERGLTVPTVATLYKIASAMGLTVELRPAQSKYDLQSFFNYFDWINVSQFAKKAGINESKMRQYKNGLAFAGESTTKKILDTIKNIGAELQSATL